MNPWLPNVFTVYIFWYRWCDGCPKVLKSSSQHLGQAAGWKSMTHLSPQLPADIFGQPQKKKDKQPSDWWQFASNLQLSLLRESPPHHAETALKRLILKQTTSSHGKNVSMLSKSFYPIRPQNHWRQSLQVLPGMHRLARITPELQWAPFGNPLCVIDIGHVQKWITLPETNSSHLKIGLPKRKLVFQPSIFRGNVSFREGNSPFPWSHSW